MRRQADCSPRESEMDLVLQFLQPPHRPGGKGLWLGSQCPERGQAGGARELLCLSWAPKAHPTPHRPAPQRADRSLSPCGQSPLSLSDCVPSAWGAVCTPTFQREPLMGTLGPWRCGRGTVTPEHLGGLPSMCTDTHLPAGGGWVIPAPIAQTGSGDSERQGRPRAPGANGAQTKPSSLTLRGLGLLLRLLLTLRRRHGLLGGSQGSAMEGGTRTQEPRGPEGTPSAETWGDFSTRINGVRGSDPMNETGNAEAIISIGHDGWMDK